MMIGGVLLAVLLGYGHWPRDGSAALGSCAAFAIAIYLTFAYPIDEVSGQWLTPPSHWKKDQSLDAPKTALTEAGVTACRPIAGAREPGTSVCFTQEAEPGGWHAPAVVAGVFVFSFLVWRWSKEEVQAHFDDKQRPMPPPTEIVVRITPTKRVPGRFDRRRRLVARPSEIVLRTPPDPAPPVTLGEGLLALPGLAWACLRRAKPGGL